MELLKLLLPRNNQTNDLACKYSSLDHRILCFSLSLQWVVAMKSNTTLQVACISPGKPYQHRDHADQWLSLLQHTIA